VMWNWIGTSPAISATVRSILKRKVKTIRICCVTFWLFFSPGVNKMNSVIKTFCGSRWFYSIMAVASKSHSTRVRQSVEQFELKCQTISTGEGRGKSH
jgi:hypothetical protein